MMEPTKEVAQGQEVQVDDEQVRIEAERKRLSEIRTQAEVAQKRHDAYLQAKDSASAAKAQWESAVETLQDLCLARDEPLPLLDGEPQELPEWRTVRLDSLEPTAKPGVLAALKDAGIETVGQLADYTKEHDLSDVLGIGFGRKREIEAVLDIFWEQRPSADEDAASEQGGNEEDGQ